MLYYNILARKFLSLLMCDQEVESCDCVDEETECSDARVQGELGADTAGVECCRYYNSSEQFATIVITKVVKRSARQTSQYLQWMTACDKMDCAVLNSEISDKIG